VDGTGRVLISITITTHAGGTEENNENSVRIDGLLAENGTQDIPNMKQQ
jgi:hypothetical protein